MADVEEVLKPGQSIKPLINEQQAKTLVERLYGFQCSSITQLNGYDDLNFKVVTCEGGDDTRDYVFKVINSLDSSKLQVVEAQCDLLIYLCTRGIQCPKPVLNRLGQYYSVEELISGKHVVRLLEYLPGCMLQQVPTTPSLLYEAGRFLGNLDGSIKPFHHTGYVNYKSIWLLEEAANLSKFLYAVENPNTKQIVEEVITEFVERVPPIKSNFEGGIIHGDFNEQNVLVQNVEGQWHITGILDFGDAHYDCYLFELAIAITYMAVHYKNLDAAGYVIAGYSTFRKLTEEEFSLLKICVAARLCQSVVYAAYSLLQDPNNEYLSSTAPKCEKLLHELWPVKEEELLSRWREISENYEKP